MYIKNSKDVTAQLQCLNKLPKTTLFQNSNFKLY